MSAYAGRFAGRTAIVTGGASGLGKAVARRIVAEGGAVALWDLNADTLADTTAEIGARYVEALDVSDLAAVERAAQASLAALGKVDILIASAGITGATVPVHEFPVDSWLRVMDINVNGLFYCNRAIVPLMLANGYGRIVNVSSVAGKEGNPNASAYSASKAAVIGFTKSLGKELAGKGVIANAITPATFESPILDQLPQAQVDYMRGKIPMGRLGEVEESAAMVCFMASEECSFTTAATFDTSGGPDDLLMREAAAFPFVDAHVHLWDLDRLRYPWLTPPFDDSGPNGSVEPIARTYLPQDYRADSAKWSVAGVVHVDAGAAPADALAETQWLERLAEETGLPSAIVAFAALDDPAVDDLLARHAAHPRVRGIRHIVNWHADPRRTYTPRDVTGDAAWREGFAALARHGLSFDLQCYPGQMVALAALFARHPETPVIVNHAGMPVDTDAAGIAEWRAGMRALAALPQVSTKLSGFGFVHRSWTIGQIRPYLLDAIDMFGTGRCMFASDFPTDKLFGSFDRHLDAYATIVADFTEDERRGLFARNANRIYRLGLDL